VFVQFSQRLENPGASGAFGVRPRLVFDGEKLQTNPLIDKPITEGASSTANRDREELRELPVH
jgi:hypothetical protein